MTEPIVTPDPITTKTSAEVVAAIPDKAKIEAVVEVAKVAAKGNNFFSFVKRYWGIIILFVLSLALLSSDLAFGIFGSLIDLPVLAFGAMLANLWLRHQFFNLSLDADAHSGYFVAQWQLLSPDKRILYNLIYVIGSFIGICLIAAGLVK